MLFRSKEFADCGKRGRGRKSCVPGMVGAPTAKASSKYSDLKIKSFSKVTGTVDIENSIPQTLGICNMRIVEGLIDKNGKIKTKSSDLIDCND